MCYVFIMVQTFVNFFCLFLFCQARKSLRRLKGFTKLKILTQGHSVRKQASTAITYLHSWSKIQAEIRARRICMVTEDRIRRKKLDSQLKLEAKLHDLEVTFPALCVLASKAKRFSKIVFWDFFF